MDKKKIKILVTNDDGIDSPGIYALVSSLKRLGEVIVIAPDRQQSAVGHCLTVSKPIRVTKFHRDGKMFGYAINGTPSDCVKIAVSTLLDEKPDLLVSGINHGLNTSISVIYSGTVSAATEGMLLGIPSIAISSSSFRYSDDCSAAAEYAYIISKKILESPLPEETFLNVNVPSIPYSEIKGMRITHQGTVVWKDKYEKRVDPFGRDYYWFCGDFIRPKVEPDSDDTAIEEKYVSVTPIRFKFTNYEYFDFLKNNNFDNFEK